MLLIALETVAYTEDELVEVIWASTLLTGSTVAEARDMSAGAISNLQDLIQSGWVSRV